jgi:hypothetical protein
MIVHVRFAPKADIASRHRPLPLCAKSGHNGPVQITGAQVQRTATVPQASGHFFYRGYGPRSV